MSLCTHYRNLKLSPFITAHNGKIISYNIFILATGSTSFTGPYWWSEQENNTGCSDSHTMVSCSINAASFCFPHTWSRWSFDSILTSMHTSEASSTKKMKITRTLQTAWDKWVFVRLFGFNVTECCIQATCYIQPALTLSQTWLWALF